MEAAGFNPYNSFNSTLVQLKVLRISGLWTNGIGFNSTLVQLKVDFIIRDKLIFIRFQFYLSSIKRKTRW